MPEPLPPSSPQPQETKSNREKVDAPALNYHQVLLWWNMYLLRVVRQKESGEFNLLDSSSLQDFREISLTQEQLSNFRADLRVGKATDTGYANYPSIRDKVLSSYQEFPDLQQSMEKLPDLQFSQETADLADLFIHDVGNAITGLAGYQDVLLRKKQALDPDGENPQTYEDFLKTERGLKTARVIHQSWENVVSLVKGVNLETGEVSREPERVQQTLNTLRTAIKLKKEGMEVKTGADAVHLDLELHIPENLEMDIKWYTRLNISAVKRLVDNFLLNSEKAIQAKEIVQQYFTDHPEAQEYRDTDEQGNEKRVIRRDQFFYSPEIAKRVDVFFDVRKLDSGAWLLLLEVRDYGIGMPLSPADIQNTLGTTYLQFQAQDSQSLWIGSVPGTGKGVAKNEKVIQEKLEGGLSLYSRLAAGAVEGGSVILEMKVDVRENFTDD